MSSPGEIRNDAVLKSSDERCFKMGQLSPPETRVGGNSPAKPKQGSRQTLGSTLTSSVSRVDEHVGIHRWASPRAERSHFEKTDVRRHTHN